MAVNENSPTTKLSVVILNNQERKMPKVCDKPLRENPFTAYRDPKTGKWIILKSNKKN